MEREYDIIIYGATSITAKYLIPYLRTEKIKFALASRNTRNLETDLPKISCELTEIDGLTCKTALLINCAGPYVFTGEPIIDSCIRNKTHYIDVTGETYFINSIIQKYDKAAKNNNVAIVNCCGLDSVPADMGVELLKMYFDEVEIEGVFQFTRIKINRATWASLIYGLTNVSKMRNLRVSKAVKTSKVPEYEYDAALKGYKVKFHGTDSSVVKRTQSAMAENGFFEVPYIAMMYVGGIWSLILYYVFGAVFLGMIKLSLTKRLLLRFPSFFSGGFVRSGQPTEKDVADSSFRLILRGRGTKGDAKIKKTLVVSGPDPATTATGIILSQCAMSMLSRINEEERLFSCGVMTPGMAFYDSDLVERLRQKNIRFDVTDE